nr:hypothetical protein [Actinomycetales bacterium]
METSVERSVNNGRQLPVVANEARPEHAPASLRTSEEGSPSPGGYRQGWRDPLGLRAISKNRASITLLLMLLGVNLVYIVQHVRSAAAGAEGSLYYVDLEHGYPEAFQALQWLWCLGLLLLITV